MIGSGLMLRRLPVAIRMAWRSPVFRGPLLSLGLVLLGATFFYHSVVTGLTIGYGDLAPSTDFSKLFTLVYALVSVGLFVAVGASLARALVAHNAATRHQHKGPSLRRVPRTAFIRPRRIPCGVRRAMRGQERRL